MVLISGLGRHLGRCRRKTTIASRARRNELHDGVSLGEPSDGESASMFELLG
jgi:hypothetical protein